MNQKSTKLPLLLSMMLAMSIGGYAIMYALNAYLSHSLSPAEYGDIALILQLLILLMPFILIGTELSSIKFLPTYLDQNRHSAFNGFMSWSIKLFTKMSILFLFGCGLVLWLLYYAPALEKHVHLFFYAGWTVPLFAFIYLELILFQVMRRYLCMQFFVQIVLFGLIFIVVMLFGLHFKHALAPRHVIAAIGIACLISIVLQFLILLCFLPKHLITATPAYKKHKWFIVSISMMKIRIITVALGVIDMIMIELLGKDEAYVGVFAALLTITGITSIIPKLLQVILQPRLAPLFEAKKLGELQALLDKLGGIKMASGTLVTIAFLIFPGLFLSAFHIHYHHLANLLRLMAIVNYLPLWFSYAQVFLMFADHEKKVALATFLQLALIIILDLYLIPHYHVLGAIISLGIANTIVPIGLALLSRKYVPIRTSLFI